MWHAKSADATLAEFSTDPKTGLTDSEIAARLARFGPNQLTEQRRRSLFVLLIAQLHNALIYILAAAAVVSGLMGEVSDAVIIGVVVVVNAVVGVIQESKAEAALMALQKLASPIALVRRGGELREVATSEVVPGDIVVLDAGRFVPCDVRLVETANLKIDESALTGESVPVEKDANLTLDPEGTALGDQRNMAFMATVTTYGRGEGVAVGTGMNTEIGRIAEMIETEEDEQTPLQRKLALFGRQLGIAILILCAVVFAVSLIKPLLQDGGVERDALFELFLTAVSLAVAAIPEGLPAIVTLVLALGMQKMVKKGAIVRRLTAVETLGSVTVICSDKTGTLTQNRMTVTRFYADGESLDIGDIDDNNSAHRMLLLAGVLCNDASYSPEGEGAATGDPTEVALLEAGSNSDLDKTSADAEYPRVAELPFDSVRKLMTTVSKDDSENGSLLVSTKGALGGLLDICTHVLRSDGPAPLDSALRKEILLESELMSREALRVLGSAFRRITEVPSRLEELEQDLVFAGFVGMMDPPRLEVKDSIAVCRASGIRTVMITGDHRSTALAIARELGIASEESEAISGVELDGLSEEQLARKSRHLRVFARVSPEHKVRIVKALKSNGNIVSMTGDGVNDAPSLKAADIGVAMGRSGTDVAKSASDMVLTDDNFQTIVAAVEEGRNIYQNIKKSIIFLLSSNAGEIIAVFGAILIGWKPPLLPIHILWVNLITDTLPALSLGADPGDPDVVNHPPRNPKESIFAGGAGRNTLLNGGLIGLVTLVAYFIGLRQDGGSLAHARTIAFAVLSISQLFHAFNLRHPTRSIFQIGLWTNKNLLASLVAGALIQWALITIEPVAAVFKVEALAAREWLLVLGFAIVPLVANEIAKLFSRLAIATRSGP